MLGQQRQIGVVLEPGLERQIEVALLLVQRKIGPAVHREREHPRLVAEDGGGTVALMDVEVDHERPLDPCFGEQHAGRDRDVVEHAESRAVIGESVMAAAGGVAGEPVLEREPRGEQRAAVRGPRARRDLGRDRQTDPAHRRGIEGLAQHRLDVRRRVRQLEPGRGRRRRHVDLLRRDQAVLEQERHQSAELGHREAMARRHRRDIGGVMNHRQHGQDLASQASPRRAGAAPCRGRQFSWLVDRQIVESIAAA